MKHFWIAFNSIGVASALWGGYASTTPDKLRHTTPTAENAGAEISAISDLAMAELRQLPSGRFRPSKSVWIPGASGSAFWIRLPAALERSMEVTTTVLNVNAR